MTDQAFVLRYHPDAEIASCQAGVHSEYCVRCGGWPPTYLTTARLWPKNETDAWYFARQYVERKLREAKAKKKLEAKAAPSEST